MTENRQANGAKFPELSQGQVAVLKWHNLVRHGHGAKSVMGHGIYKSLVIRRLLRPCRGGYELTPEGKALVARIVVET